MIIFIITTKHINLENILNKVNSCDKNIQFTMEEEEKHSFAYLDLKIAHKFNKNKYWSTSKTNNKPKCNIIQRQYSITAEISSPEFIY